MAEITNDDRAELTRHLVQQFHDANYWHPDGEPWSTVIMDLVADLMHLYDRLPEEHRDLLLGEEDDAHCMIERAAWHYQEEVDEEKGART